MVSQLSSGTSTNPTLSITAPPGMQFFNDVKVVPLVYGNALLEGTIISDLNASMNASSANGQGFGTIISDLSANGQGASLWQAICFGKITLNSILYDSTVHLMPDGSKYDAANFNNGDPVSFDIHKPTIYSKPAGTNAYTLLPYLSALHGIAHYYFSGANAVPWVDSSNNTVKKVRYDISRILQTGIASVGDNIPWNGIIVDEYHTIVTFLGCRSGTVFQNTCVSGYEVLLKFNASQGVNWGLLLNQPVGTAFLFDTPATLRLPYNLQPGTIYYTGVQRDIDSTGTNAITIRATQNGDPIHWAETHPDVGDNPFVVTANVSLTLNRSAGNNPASIIFDILTNKFYGLGLDSTIDINPATGTYSSGNNVDINVASFWNVLQYFYNNKTKPYGINCTFQEQTSAQDIIKKICEWTDCVLTIDNNGKYYLTVNDAARLYTQGRMGGITLSSLQTIDSNGVPQLSTDDFIDFAPTFGTFDGTINEFRAKYTSFADSYTNLQVFFRNEANIAETGTTRSKEYDLAGIIYPEIVATRMNEVAKRESFPLITISTTCKIGLISALVNDIYKIIHAEYGISDYFKITKKTVDIIETGHVKIEWVQCAEIMFDLNGSPLQQAEASVPSNTPPDQTLPGITTINLTFPAGSNTSTVRVPVFTTDVTSSISWGVGQLQTGAMVYTTSNPPTGNDDYTIVNHNQVIINPTKWANTIQSNTLGLLNIDTAQGP